MDRTGQLLDGKYQILRLLGAGGMGAVYEAQHRLLARRCAVKFLRTDTALEAAAVTRFLREAQAASAIGHPGIIDIHDVGFAPDGVPYLVMELLEGHTLEWYAGRGRTLPPPQAAEIVAHLLCALEAAHRHGIVHRDLKPENVFLVGSGVPPRAVKILDFGISHMTAADPGERVTRTGMVIGTPEYMAPEQADGRPDIDHRLDLYAAGVILFECLTGRVPFEGRNYNQLILKIVHDPFPDPRSVQPDLPPALAELILRACAKDPARRFPSAAAMVHALEPLLGARTRARLELPPDEEPTWSAADRAAGPAELATGETVAAPARTAPGPADADAAGAAAVADPGRTPAARPRPATEQAPASAPRRAPGAWVAGSLVVAALAAAAVVAWYLLDRPAEPPGSDDAPALAAAETLATPDAAQAAGPAGDALVAAAVPPVPPPTDAGTPAALDAATATDAPHAPHDATTEPERPVDAGPPAALQFDDLRADAPSWREPAGRTSYEPALMVDGDLDTAWNAEGGVGSRFTVSWPGRRTVTRVELIPGYYKTRDDRVGDRFAFNRVLRDVVATFSDGTRVEHSFARAPTFQELPLPGPVHASSFTVEVRSWYPGEAPNQSIADLCVSEVRVYGRPD
jgi:serine/threonine-protein kinase